MKTLLLAPPAPRLRNPATAEEDLLPPKTWVPLGIAYLAGALRAAGEEVGLKDLHDDSFEDAAALLRSERPDVVGISCFTMGRTGALRLASLARRELPGAFIVMGGPHATFYPEHMLANPAVDAAALGEGEETIVELVRCLTQGGDLGAVSGLALRGKTGIRRTSPRARSTNLDGLAFPVLDAFDLNQYKSPEIPAEYQRLTGTHLLTSRGCPFQCGFCSVNRFFEGRWASRSPQNVIDEICEHFEERDVRHLYFSDDLFTRNRRRVVELCREIIDRQSPFLWMAETRVDLVDAELLSFMRRAGCHRIYYGVESGSARTLKAANKGFTPEQVRQAFDLTRRAGIDPCCFLMVGNPGESPETIAETVALVRDIRPAATPILGVNSLYPGSPQYDRAVRLGVISDDYWLSEAPPPPNTTEHDVDDLIQLQMQLARGVAPMLYEQMLAMGLDEKYFLMRRMAKGMFRDA